jgi:hypothetical protein
MSIAFLAGVTACALVVPTIAPTPAAHVMAWSRFAARIPETRGDFSRSLMDEMIARGEDTRSGNSPDPEVGRYVIVIVKLPSSDPRAIQKGRQDAMKQIGEYLGASVEASTEAGYKEKSGADGKSESSSFFKDYSAVRVNQTLGAVDMIGLGGQDGRTVAGFVLSEGAAKRMQQISEESAKALKAKNDGQPLEVEATGIALIEADNQAAAQEQALAVAKRSALEMAMGASVIGLSVMDRDDSTETFRQTCFSTSEGDICSFRVLSEGAQGRSYLVRIRATVQQGKLLENYRSHLRSIGDPVFCIDASGDKNIQLAANAFFEEKGFRIKEGGDCGWTIRLEPRFNEREDPRNNARQGYQCLITARLSNLKTGEVFADAGATAKDFDSMDGGPDVQKRRAAEKAFKNMREELHKKIEGTILRLAREGRPVTVEVRGIGTIDGATTKLTDALALRPGINDAKVNLRPDGTVVVELKALVASDLVARFVGADACACADGKSTPVLLEQDDSRVVIDIKGARP